MRGPLVAALLLSASCGGEPEPTLMLEGPDHVRVETLGPVDGPRIVGPDGTTPYDLELEVSSTHVARVKGNRVVAIGRGEATVTGRWHDAAVTWDLVVDPAVSLMFDDPPSVLQVGESEPIKVRATIGGEPAIPVDLEWAVRPDGIVDLQPGTVLALSPGTAWVSCKHGSSEAMLELEVVPASPANTDTP